MKNCLLCGVGGQGTVLASRIIAAAAMAKGLDARTAETIGMAQRGGSVVSHVRIGEVPGEKVTGPLVPEGSADVLIGFEPGEAARNLRYLRPDGVVIVCEQEVRPVTASLGQSGYRGEDAVAYLKQKAAQCFVIDVERICGECGSPRVTNVALVGAMAGTGAMSLAVQDMEKALETRLRPSLLEMNRKALRMGAEGMNQL